VRGVPFFVFDRKFAISGAQESNVFLTSLEKSFAEWKKANPNAILNIVDGKVCEPNKDCK
jgi:protein disulfide-isomerase